MLVTDKSVELFIGTHASIGRILHRRTPDGDCEWLCSCGNWHTNLAIPQNSKPPTLQDYQQLWAARMYTRPQMLQVCPQEFRGEFVSWLQQQGDPYYPRGAITCS